MAGQNTNLVMLTACADPAEAERIAHALLDARVAGCVQILPKMRSFYIWEGRTESADEHLLLIKTSAAHQDAVGRTIAELHSYDVPEILALPVAGGSASYLNWLNDLVG